MPTSLTLRKNGVDGENDEREKGCCPHENPKQVAKEKPRDECPPFVGIPGPHASYREPLQTDLESFPKATGRS